MDGMRPRNQRQVQAAHRFEIINLLRLRHDNVWSEEVPALAVEDEERESAVQDVNIRLRLLSTE